MALVFMDGFDAGDFLTKWTYVYSSVATPGTVTATRFTAGRSLNTPSSQAGGYSGVKRIFPQSSTFILGVAYMCNVVTAGRSMIILWGDDGITPHLSLSFDQTTGRLGLYRGDHTTLIATSNSPGLIMSNQWCFLEIMATISDVGGACTVRCNGITEISYSGDTKNGGTNSTIDAITLQAAIQGAMGANYYWDDLYICDDTGPAPYNTFLGDTRVVTMSPSGAGASTQLTPDSGSNYARVNEMPYSAANNVTGTTPGQRDTYTLTDLPFGVAQIFAVQNNVVAKKTSTGAIAVKSAIKSGAGVYYGAAFSSGTTDTTVSDLRTIDPNTSAAWTVGGVNSLEAGLEIA